MTERLYYNDSSLLEFDATVTAVEEQGDQALVSLDRSAFYPTSGGQNFDTGEIFGIANGSRVRVIDVQEQERTGDILHLYRVPSGLVAARGTSSRRSRRRSPPRSHAAALRPARALGGLRAAFQLRHRVLSHGRRPLHHRSRARKRSTPSNWRLPRGLANEVIAEDRPVEIRFATPDEARTMGVRKIPPAVREKLRLIDIRDFDLNACGGTHVGSTGQIGAILLRKTEKVKQGVRVEFVCGLRAVSTARRDFQTLTDAAAVFSTHLWEVPQQARKSLDEIKSAQKAQHQPVGRSRRVAGREPASIRRRTCPVAAARNWSFSSSLTAISASSKCSRKS